MGSFTLHPRAPLLPQGTPAMSTRHAPSLPPSRGQVSVPKHELEYIPFAIASKTIVKATADEGSPLSNDDAKVPHLGESAFQDLCSVTSSDPDAYLNMDPCPIPPRLTQRAGSLTLQQAFEYPDSYCDIAAVKQLTVQELPLPRASETRKHKMNVSGLNEKYARMTTDMSILVQQARTVAVVMPDIFVRSRPMMEHTANGYYGGADGVAGMSSLTQAMPIQTHSPLQSAGLSGQYGLGSQATIQSSSITQHTATAPYAPQGTACQRNMAPFKTSGAYSTPHFRFSPPGGRAAEGGDHLGMRHTSIYYVDSECQESNQAVPVNQSLQGVFQPHVHVEDTPHSSRVKPGVGGNTQPIVKRPRKEDRSPSMASLTSITPRSMPTVATTTSTNDTTSQSHFDFSETVKSMGQMMRAYASAAVTLPCLSTGYASVVANGSSQPSQTVSLHPDSVLMPPPEYVPQRVTRGHAASEDQPMDDNESMMYDGLVSHDANGECHGYDFAIDEQYEARVRPLATEKLDGIMGLEGEVRGLID